MSVKKYTAKYFTKTEKIVNENLPNSIVTVQFFQREDDSLLSGIEEVIEFLKKNTNIKKYEIKYLKDGTIINSKDVVLQLKGNYKYFGIYEGVIDGILSRATSLATNAKKILSVSNNKEVIFMGDRCDHYLNQERDGKSIALGGITNQVTDAQVELHNGLALGTIPHILIQMFQGDLIKALKAYKKTFPNEKIVSLVDFHNDVIKDSIKSFREFKDDLFAVRVDTSLSVSDAMFLNNEEYGVTPNLIKRLRKALDEEKAYNVKIIVSSGFNFEKIKKFEEEKTPVDIYGVGASLLKINNHFTADAVGINSLKISKFGRKMQDVSHLITFKKKYK